MTGFDCGNLDGTEIDNCAPHANRNDVVRALQSMCQEITSNNCVVVVPSGTPTADFIEVGFDNVQPPNCEELTVIYDDGSAIYKAYNQTVIQWIQLSTFIRSYSRLQAPVMSINDGANATIDFSTVVDDPYGFSDGTGFTIPSGFGGEYLITYNLKATVSSGTINAARTDLTIVGDITNSFTDLTKAHGGGTTAFSHGVLQINLSDSDSVIVQPHSVDLSVAASADWGGTSDLASSNLSIVRLA